MPSRAEMRERNSELLQGSLFVTLKCLLDILYTSAILQPCKTSKRAASSQHSSYYFPDLLLSLIVLIGLLIQHKSKMDCEE